MNFSKFVLQEQRKQAISVVCQTETAEYFGWLDAFPSWDDRFKADYSGGKKTYQYKHNNDPRDPGGKRLFICRSKRTTGHPQGMTHCFRVKGSFSRKHLIQLAQVAGDKFEWMEGQYGARIKRAEWEAFYGEE